MAEFAKGVFLYFLIDQMKTKMVTIQQPIIGNDIFVDFVKHLI